jgi:hypothetical protein
MPDPDRTTLAVAVALLGALLILAGSFIPFFVAEVWGPLWGVEWWPPGGGHSFGRVGPLYGISAWPVLLAVPISATTVAILFVVMIGLAVVGWRGAIISRLGGE